MTNDTNVTRVCNRCGEAKPRTLEHWYREKQSPDGLGYACRPCERARANTRNMRKRVAQGRPAVTPQAIRRERERQKRHLAPLRSLIRIANTAAHLQLTLSNQRNELETLAAEVTSLVAIAIEHSTEGVHRSAVTITPEAFEIALRYASGDSEVFTEHRCAPPLPNHPRGQLVRYSTPVATPEAIALHQRYGRVPAIPDNMAVNQSLAMEASLLGVSIRSRSHRLGLPLLCTGRHEEALPRMRAWTNDIIARAVNLGISMQKPEWIMIAFPVPDQEIDGAVMEDDFLMAA